MKILHVEAGKHLYGGARQVQYITEGLAARGIESLLACPIDSEMSRQPPAGVRVLPIRMGGDGDIGLAFRLARLIRAEMDRRIAEAVEAENVEVPLDVLVAGCVLFLDQFKGLVAGEVTLADLVAAERVVLGEPGDRVVHVVVEGGGAVADGDALEAHVAAGARRPAAGAGAGAVRHAGADRGGAARGLRLCLGRTFLRRAQSTRDVHLSAVVVARGFPDARAHPDRARALENDSEGAAVAAPHEQAPFRGRRRCSSG